MNENDLENYNHDYFHYGDFSNRIVPHWEDTRTPRSTLDRSRARSLARLCICSQVSRHLTQVNWVKIIRGSFGPLQISTGQQWKPDEALVARDPAEAEPKWTKSNGNIISPEVLIFIFQLDT